MASWHRTIDLSLISSLCFKNCIFSLIVLFFFKLNIETLNKFGTFSYCVGGINNIFTWRLKRSVIGNSIDSIKLARGDKTKENWPGVDESVPGRRAAAGRCCVALDRRRNRGESLSATSVERHWHHTAPRHCAAACCPIRRTGKFQCSLNNEHYFIAGIFYRFFFFINRIILNWFDGAWWKLKENWNSGREIRVFRRRFHSLKAAGCYWWQNAADGNPSGREAPTREGPCVLKKKPIKCYLFFKPMNFSLIGFILLNNLSLVARIGIEVR